MTAERPIVLLDEMVLGMSDYLLDAGWKTEKATEVLGNPVSDAKLVQSANSGKYVLISLDKKLMSRCRVKGIKTIELRFEDLARIALERLDKEFG
ncbi:MAG: hypothetical protein E6K96_05215 [Thaumarchaeota archaeon]|nr:MAG: hypothetical protein E6K96_05215 [Nitrososphaerota archaeon]